MSPPRSPDPTSAPSAPALIVGIGVTALGVIRILGRRGIPLWVAPGDDVTRHSRWFRPAPAAAGRHLGNGLAPYLEGLGIERAVLFPCSDELALEAAGLPTHLARRFPTYQPSVATLERVLDKWGFHSVLREHDIPGPRTYLVDRPDDTRSIEWKGEGRPETLKSKIDVGEYNKIAAQSVLTILTRGYRDVHLERRSDNIFLVRSGLIEDDTRVVLCRQFITEMALTARQTAVPEDARLQILHEIHAAARDLVLPDWYPIKDAPR